MELFFYCPQRHAGFWSDHWSVDETLRVAEDSKQRKYLLGVVRVSCPLCGDEHAFRPAELACPLAMNDAKKTDE